MVQSIKGLHINLEESKSLPARDAADHERRGRYAVVQTGSAETGSASHRVFIGEYTGAGYVTNFVWNPSIHIGSAPADLHMNGKRRRVYQPEKQ